MSETYLYSLAYAKYGDAVFYSHLDTVRILERALRRTGVGVSFTHGWNPHIRLSTRRAIPLGVATDREWFSFRLVEDLKPEYLSRLMNEQLPQGFFIVDALRGAPGEEEEAPRTMAVHFSGTAEEARSAAERLMARERIEIEGVRKGKPYTRDMKPFLESFHMEEGAMVFRFRDWEDQTPKISEMARVLADLSFRESLIVESIKVVKDEKRE
ncbi:MAG: TIGR03936 family radical SAM-associated protein [Planctomycetota bacterium]|jgi:radical SAM-linked protein